MIYVAAVLGGLGVSAMLYRPTLIGVLIGVQMLSLGAALGFVVAGVASFSVIEGHIFGFFILTGSVGVFATFLALGTRLFALRGRATLEEVKTLRN